MQAEKQNASSQQHAGKVIVVGAGFSGIYATYALKRSGLDVTTLEAGSDVGGTWYWNRYPGARVDSENYFYNYAFSKELSTGWNWDLRYNYQPDLQRYLSYATDKLGIRDDITFNAKVTAARWIEDGNFWEVTVSNGQVLHAQFLWLALGCLSKPIMPNIPGISDFKGQMYFTGSWPHDPVDLTGKKVGLIGTGSSGSQVVGAVAPIAEQLVVFQRTANWVLPVYNGPITDEFRQWFLDNHEELHKKSFQTPGGFPFDPSAPTADGMSKEDRTALLERQWKKGGINYIQTFGDTTANPETNEIVKELPRQFIKDQIDDPKLAEKLTPDHPIFTKRPIMDDNYLKSFNRPNVTLADIKENPIVRIEGNTVFLEDGEQYELDVLILATGFDAMTGRLLEMNIEGTDGLKLRDYWSDGPRNYLGLATAGFPNLFQIVGPFSPSILANVPLCGEQHAEWVIDCIQTMQEQGATRIEAQPDAERAWVQELKDTSDGLLMTKVKSWYNGSNVEGKPEVFPIWAGGFDAYKKRCDQVANDGYVGFTIE